MLIRLFKPITKNEHLNISQHEVDLLKQVTQKKGTYNTMQKCPIGQLYMQLMKSIKSQMKNY
jgi:hypothetical protein